ncbi:reverse transcriptase domain-containing protein, partial [Tanacetum coccineum]
LQPITAIIAEKFNKENERNEKLKEVKARLNFEGCSRTVWYSESRMMSAKEHEERHRSRRPRSLRPSPSVFSRIRRNRLRSPTPREKEGGVFKRLGNKGKSLSTLLDNHNQRSYSRYTEALSESKDDLSQPWAASKTERWAMPTWCHMFNSTLTGNTRVWFDDLSAESIDIYDDLKKAFLENYLQQKKCIKDPIEIHNIKK